MKKSTITSLLILVIISSVATPMQFEKEQNSTKTIQVEINKNVEFLGLLNFLGYKGKRMESENGSFTRDGKQIKWRDWNAYGWYLYKKYKPFYESTHLSQAMELVGNIEYGYFIRLVLQLENFPQAKITNNLPKGSYIQFSDKRDQKEAWKNAAKFLDALNRFYKEINFDEYWETHKAIYQNTVEQVRKVLPSENFIKEMEKFYQGKFDSYILIPSPSTSTSSGFGLKLTDGEKTDIYNVFGPLWFQKFKNSSDLDMGFGNKDKVREKSTHEFGHSFVDLAMNKIPRNSIKATEKLFHPIQEAMADQSYLDWETCLDEHFTRAGEIIIAENMENWKSAGFLRHEYIENRKFIYLPIILEELQKYNRKKEISYQQAVNNAMEKLIELAKS
ncbi:DUF4932 domain-containing protein [Xanthovirga aplysinae]|uniref:DUF4932 domain-containing protein n=1 Tax=Xanthovirga aplysinae TaxID=2529853 RepID=UPI0012BBAE70|nr:DUF4932 domain-containing protein [Xanthovirga aplysinae]MTI31512.1 DUF4932 domain-containing protein [Xanthovirga aplysinae]